MNFIERIKRLKKLGNEQIFKETFENTLEINQISLDNVIDMQNMANTSGWQVLSHMMREDEEKRLNSIVELSIDPEKNAYQIILQRGILETLRRLRKVVSRTIDKKEILEKQKVELLRTKRSF